MFNFFKSAFTKTTNSPEQDQEIEVVKKLDYNNVREIYETFPLGSRIINLPISLAFTGIKYNHDLEKLGIELSGIHEVAKQFIRTIRIYGVAVIYPILDKEDDLSNPLFQSDLYDKNIRYNVLEPLTFTANIDLDPTSFSYKKITSINIKGKPLYRKRTLALTNKETNLFLSYNNASFNYVGLSCFQNIYSVLNLLNTSLIALERMMLQSSLFILEQGDTTISSNLNDNLLKTQAELLRKAKQNSVIILKNGLKLSQFALSNLAPLQETLNQINNLLSLSGSDIPPVIFAGERLSSSFNEGSQELVQLNNYLNNIREGYIIPTMKFLLSYEIFNKVENVALAQELVDTLEITFNTAPKESIIENAKELQETNILSSSEIKEEIKN